MEREFAGSTREEAVRLADEWWRTQNGLMLITRYVYPAHDAPGVDAANRWRVLIHYKQVRPHEIDPTAR
jgi:hypothetical protein